MTLPPLYLTLTSSQSPVMVLQTTTGQLPADKNAMYGGFNLGLHVQDNPTTVHQNRLMLLNHIQQQYPHIQRIGWLNQVHGGDSYQVSNTLKNQAINADAHITSLTDTALAIMTADCVPIMISDAAGDIIAAVHAGWQGLAQGIIANTLQHMLTTHATQVAMCKNTASITQTWHAWIGACIAQDNYEVDSRVKDKVMATLSVDTMTSHALFRPNPQKDGHYFADLAKVAELQLNTCGVVNVVQSGLDSYGDQRFYSYRKQTQQQLPHTGRMATLIFKA